MPVFTKQLRRLRAVRKNIAYVPESAALYGHLSAYENLMYFLRLAQRPSTTAALDDALTRVGLDKQARGQKLSQYSKRPWIY